MEIAEEKPLRKEILKVEVDLRNVKKPKLLLENIKETLIEFCGDKASLELIPIFSDEKWFIPKSTFVNLSVTKDTCEKLRRWKLDKDSLMIDASNGKLLIINEIKLNERQLKKAGKKARTRELG